MKTKNKKRPVLDKTSRIGIVNRGEAAVRFIRAVREYNSLYSMAINTAAFFLDMETDALFVKEADVIYPLSQIQGFTENRCPAYLNRELMLKALISANCQAVWVGWGFLAEDSIFAKMIEDAGIVFLGPSAQSMGLLGDKISAKVLAERASVPILPWSNGPVKDLEDAQRVSEKIGYPMIVKAANAGGGRGIRFVRKPVELASQFQAAKEEAIRTYGSDVLFIEHLVVTGRHLEVQILADRYGTVQTFGVRDCSVQRRNQKIIEETPPPHFDQKGIKEMEEAAARLIREAHYESAGTVEFLYDCDEKQFYFMEVNTRLQVEHPITEQLYDVDLVMGQIDVAFGKKLEEHTGMPRGAAIELRLNAEDPDREFTPAPGRVSLFKIPAGPGIRVDSGIEQGSTIPSEFDSMIAKIIGYGPTRDVALARLKRALKEMRIKLEGGTSNRAFLLGLLNCEQIRHGGVHTHFVEYLLNDQKGIIQKEKWDIALIACAIEQAISRYNEKLINFKQQWSSIGQPRDIPPSCGYEVTISLSGENYSFLVKALAGNIFHLSIDGRLLIARYVRGDQESLLFYNDIRYTIQMVPREEVMQCEVDGIPYALEIESSDFIKAPFPSIVISIAVAPGQTVQKGELLLELEAMKTVMGMAASKTGTVKSICIRTGERVAAGQPLIQMASDDQVLITQECSMPRVCFETPQSNDPLSIWQVMEKELLAVFLGYDYSEDAIKILQDMVEFVKENAQFQEKFVKSFLAVLEIYSAIENLFCQKRIESEGFASAASYQELLIHFFIRNECKKEGLPQQFLDSLERSIRWYPQEGLNEKERYNQALFRIYKSHANLQTKQEALQTILYAAKGLPGMKAFRQEISNLLDEIADLTQNKMPTLSDAAIQARYHLLDSIFLETMKKQRYEQLKELEQLTLETNNDPQRSSQLMDNIINTGHYIVSELILLAQSPEKRKRKLVLELLAKYFNRDREFVSGRVIEKNEALFYQLCSSREDKEYETIVMVTDEKDCGERFEEIKRFLDNTDKKVNPELIMLFSMNGIRNEEREENIIQNLYREAFPVCWCCLGFFYKDNCFSYRTFYIDQEWKWQEDLLRRFFNPLFFRELKVYLLAQFNLQIIYSSESVYLVSAVAKDNKDDERLIALVDVPESRAEIGEEGAIQRIVAFDFALMEAIYAMSAEKTRRNGRLYLNRIIMHVHSLLTVNFKQMREYASRLAPRGRELGMEKVVIYARHRKKEEDELREFELHLTNISSDHFSLDICPPSKHLLMPMTNEYVSKVVRAKQRGNVYPYEIIKMITQMELGYADKTRLQQGNFEEFDIHVNGETGTQKVFAVRARPYGLNKSNIVFGVITNYTNNHPSGIERVLILVDTTQDMGSLAEAECRRIIAALDLAENRQLPVEWLPVSSGAKIDMDSGTENLDWTALVLKRIIEFTQSGGEINQIVSGINVGAQSYWNAEATMLMHTKGILIMTEDASILLTGKKALDFSGSVSAEDNVGIGGVEKIMGPNGQAQIRVKGLSGAYMVLFQHYIFTYREHGGIFPKHISTTDTPDRDIGLTAYHDRFGHNFTWIGDIFSKESNPERKKPFDMRQVMFSVIDQDLGFLERWQMMKDAETAIVWEARIGGHGAGLLGIESRPLARLGRIPHDGPESWTAGTLFPQSSKKLARAINAYSRHLPIVILANLSGFDGSPESLRKLQLEFGAEIGRAVVNFQGPIIFIVVARYHGGAYVVFSRTLNPLLRSVALEDSYASVIGGAPAAAVVFPKKVLKATYADPRIQEAQIRMKEDLCFSRKDYDDLFKQVHSEKQTALAQRFDQIHSVERAKRVGSIDEIIPSSHLRPYIIKALEEGMAQYIDQIEKKDNSFKLTSMKDNMERNEMALSEQDI